MLTQVFESVPRTMAIHQPDAPTLLHFLCENKTMSDKEYMFILRSIVRVLCKPHPGIKRICIKVRPHCTTMMTDISAIYPNIKQIFMYRNSLDTIRSYLSVMRIGPYPVVLRTCKDMVWFSNCVPYVRNIRTFKIFYVQTKNIRRCST